MAYTKWVAAWGNAASFTERRVENYAKNVTLRYRIPAVFNGSALRLTFSNITGCEDARLSGVTVAEAASDTTIKAGSAVRVTFGGKEEAVIPQGGEIVSDEIAFDVKRGNDLSVSIYLADFTEMSSGVAISGPLVHNTFAVGNHLFSEDMPLDQRQATGWYHFLTTIDVLTEPENHALIVYGDSITSQSWPDHLTLRTIAEGDEHVSIIRRAVSGSRVLRQYDCLSYRQYGLKGEARFAREMKTAGAEAVVILHGVNDTIHPDGVNPFRPMCHMPTVEDMIEGMRFYIRTAHEMGLKIYLGTVLPIEGWRTYEEFRNDVRLGLNEWIRSTDEADGIVDFDLALRNPDHHNALLADYDSGDHLHPGQGGAIKMAQTIPDFLLK